VRDVIQNSDDVFNGPVDFYLRELATVPVLMSESEMDLAKRIQRGGGGAETAIKDLLEANLWLVVDIAKRFPKKTSISGI